MTAEALSGGSRRDQHDQLQHDLLVWVRAGYLPHAVPVPARPAWVQHALEALLAQDLVTWSKVAWRYTLTSDGEHAVDACTRHAPSPQVAAAIAAPAVWGQTG